MKTLTRIRSDLEKLRRLADRAVVEVQTTNPSLVPAAVALQVRLAEARTELDNLSDGLKEEVVRTQTEP